MRSPQRRLLPRVVLALVIAGLSGETTATAPPAAETQGIPPQSPAASLRAMRTHDSLQIELVAAEPLVDDPVAIDFGPDGKLWVAEMADYTRKVDEQFDQNGRIRFLEDTDGDGRYDKSTVFVGGLRFPTEVKLWRDGVLICDAPHILWARDKDGDGVADHTQTLYTGFATINPHARVNSLRLGLDNWLYGSGGLFGGEITSFTGHKADVTGRDFRIQPDSGAIEAVTGRTQQGRARNDWGDWFGCTNSGLLRHYPVVERYLRRNPHVPPPPTQVFVPADADANRLFPLGKLVRFKLSGAPGRPTSACGLAIYRDDLLGRDYLGNSFTCEPVNQSLHRLVLTRKGPTFTGRRAASERTQQFLASADRWFRPVQVRTGPDGALWVVDMYRYVIEHPRWIPPETIATINQFAGQGMGRIYRVYPKDQRLRTIPRFVQLNAKELAATLDTPNGTQRDLVHQLLLWRGDKSAASELERIAVDSENPAVRLQALCLLDGLQLLSHELLLRAFADRHPEVQRHVIRMAEQRFDDRPELLTAALRTATPSSPQVRLQLAYSLGEASDPRVASALARCAVDARGEPHLLAAAMSSVNSHNVDQVLRHTLATFPRQPPSKHLVDVTIRLAGALGDEQTLASAIGTISTPGDRGDYADWQFTALAQARRAARRQGWDPDNLGTPALPKQVAAVFASARRCALSAATENKQLAAITLLGSRADRSQRDRKLLGDLLAPRFPQQVQSSAIQALSDSAAAQTPVILLSAWDAASPQIRPQILDVLLSRVDWLPALLDAIDAGTLRASNLDASRRGQFFARADAALTQRAVRLFKTSTRADRQAAIAEFRDATAISGSHEAGKRVFRKRCANCHKLQGEGHAVGPDLAALTHKSPSALLVEILDPSRAVDARYLNYVALRDDGKSFTGMLAEETSTSVTLVEQADKRHVILRSQLDELRATGKSLMPDGLEKDLQVQDVADLLAYVISAVPRPKQFPGNLPTLVTPDPSGQVALLACSGEIYGGEIRFENRFGNVGHWNATADRVSWQLQLEQPGRYDVYIDWSCAIGSHGNTFRIEGVEPVLRARVVSTGGWDRYQQEKVGSISLPPGLHYITVRPDQQLVSDRELFDLRGIYLVPVAMQPQFGTVTLPPAQGAQGRR